MDTAPPRRRASRRRRALLIALVLGALLAGGLSVPARQGLRARDHLTNAAGLLLRLQDQLRRDDAPAARTSLAALQAETAAARESTGGVAWRLGGRLPVWGGNAGAVRTVAAALDDLARDALPAFVELAGSLNPADLAPKKGRVDVAPLRRIAPRLAAADATVQRVRDQVAAIPTGGLWARLRTAVEELRGGLDRVTTATASATRAVALLTAVLDAPKPRTFLVLFQNLAEVRATGGMPGAFVTVRVQRGAVRIIRQGTAGQLGTFPTPVLPLRAEQRGLYTDKLGTYPADINFTPHFPTTATLAREMYRRRFGTVVDGVLATDPVALSYLLAASGPVRIPDGPSLTSGNAVRVLLAQAYDRRTNDEQDKYVAGAARAVFDHLTRRPVDPRTALSALSRAATERRLLFWSADPAEQALVAGTVVDGVLPPRDGARPTVGVFLNDGNADKLSFYLTHSAHIAGPADGCRPDGRRTLLLRVTLGSTAPRSGLPDAVLDASRADPYTMRLQVLVFAPTGGGIARATVDGRVTRLGTGTERGRAVAALFVPIRPGVRRTLVVTLVTGRLSGQVATPELRTTPGVSAWAVTSEPLPPCR